MRNVFQADTQAEAVLVRDMLVLNGIDARVVGDRSPAHRPILSEVWVANDVDGDRAVELVRALYAQSNAASSWQCRGCLEDVPSSFEVCWKCGSSRE